MRCAVGCGHVQQAPDRGYGLRTVRGDPSHPVNRGLACQPAASARPPIRAASGSPGRSYAKTASSWRPPSNRPSSARRKASVPRWKTAGATASRSWGAGSRPTRPPTPWAKLARGGFGTRYYDANTTLCMASAVTAYYDAFGSDAPPPTYDDIPEAKTRVVWGANPSAAHPVMFRWIRQSADEDDSELIVVDPVHSETAETSTTTSRSSQVPISRWLEPFSLASSRDGPDRRGVRRGGDGRLRRTSSRTSRRGRHRRDGRCFDE